MTTTLALLPKEYSYVLLAASASGVVNVYHSLLTGQCRRAAQLPYPAPYASNEEAATSPEKHRFNCAQRAHANFTENHPTFLISMLVAGLKFPVAAGAMGACWVGARALYAYGYTRKDSKTGKADPKYRQLGGLWLWMQISLMGMAIYTSGSAALAAFS